MCTRCTYIRVKLLFLFESVQLLLTIIHTLTFIFDLLVPEVFSLVVLIFILNNVLKGDIIDKLEQALIV